MTTKENSVGKVFLKIFSGILALFALSVPLFYMDAHITLAGESIFLLYFTLRILRLISAAGFGFWLRRQYRAVLRANETARKRIMIGVILCTILLLHQTNFILVLYSSIGKSFGLMYPQNGPLLPSVVWEQFMNGDLLWALLLCTAVVFVFFRTPQKAQATR